MGPAILAYNDSEFTPEDFESIRRIGHSVKAEDIQKTGRFGVGFNAVYHVTDYPSFISRNRIVFFDPHGTAIPGTSKENPGYTWDLEKDQWWVKYPEFMKVYQGHGKKFSGTLFRLPLRTEQQASQSEIRQQVFGNSSIQKILKELINSGEELLLFLKSLLEIRFSEIPADSDGRKTELLTIRTKNPKQVKDERTKLLEAIPDRTNALLEKCQNESGALASVSYRHEIESISNEGITNTTWRVVSLIGSDSQGEITEAIAQMQAQREKAVPWAGAAARIYTSKAEGNHNLVTGRAYCFLPTPIETGLPIHINGFFNLNSARDNLSSDSGQSGRDQIKPLWNKLLVRHVLSVACANLIAELVSDIGKEKPDKFYQLWPVSTHNKVLEEIPGRVIQLLSQKRVIRSAVEHVGVETDNGKKILRKTKWVMPRQIKVFSSKKWWKSLLEPLSADGIDIPDPLVPDEIINAFKNANYGLETLTPAKLREHLHQDKPLGVPLPEAPKQSLSNWQWIVNMLGYCISDKSKDVRGLPLAILANNTLQVFGYNAIGTIYVADSEIMRIFDNKPEWFLHPNLAREVPEIGQCIGVLNMNAKEVARRLVDVIGSTEQGYPWQPDGVNSPNSEWLTQVYRYFTKVSTLPNEELREVPLVPGNDGKLYKGGLVNTPLWCGRNIDREEVEALKYFGVPLVQASPKLEEAIEQFLQKHPQKFIWFVTGPDVVNTLKSLAHSLPSSYNQKHHPSLLNFLANPLWIKDRSYNEEQKTILKTLRIYPTASNELVSLTDDKVYLPGGYNPPAVAGYLKLLRVRDAESEWLLLLKLLRVGILNRERLIVECLLPSYKSLVPEEQRIALEWIRDNLTQIKQEIEGAGESSKTLLKILKKESLLRCSDGELRPIPAVYEPNSDARQMLGDNIPLPDIAFYSSDWELWRRFFKLLGIRETASADDLLIYVNDLIETANKKSPDAVADFCIKVFDYMGKKWEQLKSDKIAKTGQTLSEALKDKAWIPVERDFNQLKQYPGAKSPEARLYRAEEVCFIDDAQLLASQKPIFHYQKSRIKPEFRKSLGFQEVNPKMVLDHFDRLIAILERK
ncbi:hypothetical protein LKK83_15425 [Phormidium sp. CCY1219]|nr:hypothetical protein [Phormidium sp. CCY1219]MEB3828876.1 hypothetical protein [Phormidium sp. CCY1219]